MTDYFVNKSGSDANDGLSTGNAFLTIQHAHDTASGGDTINVDDSSVQTYSEQLIFTKQLTVIATNTACDGTEGSGIKITYTETANSGHVIKVDTASASANVFRGFEIVLDNSVISSECIRCEANLVVENCILRATGFTASQDGIYTSQLKTIHIINCIMYHFARGCINTEGSSPDWYIQHSTLFGNSSGTATILDNNISGTTYHVDNSIIVNEDAGQAFQGTGSFETTTSGNDNVSTDSETWATQATSGVDDVAKGSGSWILFENIVAGSEDLRLRDDAGNIAQDVASTDRTANATFDPNGQTATSINGETRDYVSNHDAGAFEVVPIVGAGYPLDSPMKRRTLQTMLRR